MFTDRDTELERLREQLQTRGEALVAVYGPGGVGKTQLAVEYAWKHLGVYDAVLWVKADSPEALDRDLAALAPVLGLPDSDEREQALHTKAVHGWLQKHKRWLLIADNADTAPQ